MISVINLDLSGVRALYFSDYRAGIKYKSKFIDEDEQEFRKWLFSAVQSYELLNIDVFIAHMDVYNGWVHQHENAYKELYQLLQEGCLNADYNIYEVFEVTNIEMLNDEILTIAMRQ